MKILFLSFLSLLATSLFAQQYVVDPNAKPRQLSQSFKAIKVSGGIDLYLSQSSSEAVAVSASDDKYTDDITTVVENGILKIFTDGKVSMRNKKLKAYVSFKSLEALEASGASDVRVSGKINSPSLKLNMSGASDFVGSVEVGTLDMNLSGASDVKISGKATTVSVESSGASDVKGSELITETCHANASGASDIMLTVNKEINAKASGASSVFYSGTAVEGKITSSGASTVQKRG